MKERVLRYNELMKFKMLSRYNRNLRWRFLDIKYFNQCKSKYRKISKQELEKQCRHYRIRS